MDRVRQRHFRRVDHRADYACRNHHAVRGGGVEAYSVAYAADAAAWDELWAAVAPGSAPPALDLASEIVALFADGIGSSCPELRLDGVVVDQAAGRVYSRISDPLAPRICTADLAGSAVFVVAIERDALPPSPFTLALSEQPMTCGDCADELTIDLRQP